jgi:hypothetical protein
MVRGNRRAAAVEQAERQKDAGRAEQAGTASKQGKEVGGREWREAQQQRKRKADRGARLLRLQLRLTVSCSLLPLASSPLLD